MQISPPIGHLSGLHTGRGTGKDRPSEKAVKEWPAPVSQRDLQRFLGFTNFYRRFIQNYDQVAVPLTCFMSTKVKFLWSSETQVAFTKLKQKALHHRSNPGPTRHHQTVQRSKQKWEPFFPKGPDHRVRYKHVPFSLTVSPQLSRTMMWETESCLNST